MNVVLVYPLFKDTFWSFKYAMKFIAKKATHPPLGLLTVAAMLPANWKLKLIDMNVTELKDTDLEVADLVFISGMSIQKESAAEVFNRCKNLGKTMVAGGPLFTSDYKEFEGVDYFVLNEAEITLPLFLEDFKNGCAQNIYTTEGYPELDKTPIPNWKLINMKKYVSMSIQYSRGCPYNCEFCDITNLFGRGVRTKNKNQIITELESIYANGWRGNVLFVDDNFIGNKKKLKKEILPAMIEWSAAKKHPFLFGTEASINLSDDEELMLLMSKAGFNSVFVGIESPNEESLAECNKLQNKNRDLVASIKRIQQAGMEVQGGFIVGFDNDPSSIFDVMVEFIQKSGIVSAMVGLLNAPIGTKLYKRLEKEKRLLKSISGDNTDSSMNFIPVMNRDKLLNGYRKIISGIYSPKPYHARVKKYLEEYRPMQTLRVRLGDSLPLFKSIWFIGITDKARFHYWKLFFWSLFTHPKLFGLAITYSIYGYHFRKVFKNNL